MLTVVVDHSPTPSTVSIKAFLNGEGKNALAAWLRWCSQKNNLSDENFLEIE